jgi:hypothetical protein
MSQHDIYNILQQVKEGDMSPEDALLRLKMEPLRIWAMPRWITTESCARACAR